MKTLGLPLGFSDKQVLLDEDDYFRFRGFNWYLKDDGYVITDSSKPMRTRLGVPHKLRLHRLILGVAEGLDVDHINGNKLDNRKSNLRVCSRSENLQNKERGWKKKELPKGVHFRATSKNPKTGKIYQLKKPFFAVIRISKYKNQYLGSFCTVEEAAKAYEAASLKYHQEFSFLARRQA